MNTLSNLTILAAETAEAGEEAAGGLSTLGLDPLQILLQAGVFVVLFAIAKPLFFDKIVKALNDRHETIEESLKNAAQIEKDVAAATEKQAEMLAAARKEADVILKEAKADAKQTLADAQAAANAKNEQLLKDSRAQIAADVKAAKAELKKDVLAQVVAATEVILGEKIDAKADAKLIDKALKDLK